MFPLPAATTTLANIQPTSQTVFDAFKPYLFSEIGIFIGALVIIFVIGMLWALLKYLLSAHHTQPLGMTEWDSYKPQWTQNLGVKGTTNNSWIKSYNKKVNKYP